MTVWGGPNALAQALWKIRKTRSPEEVDACIQRLRVYTISDQDDTGPWIRNTFAELFYIVSPGNNYRRATWAGISGENWYHFSSAADLHIVSNDWLKDSIRENHGPLGEQYPAVAYIILAVTDSGSPSLTRYHRVILTLQPNQTASPDCPNPRPLRRPAPWILP